jgi:hypothetical protein
MNAAIKGFARRSLAATGLCCLLAACSTVHPTLPKPKSDQDTLFVVPVLVLDTMATPTAARGSFAYQFNLQHVKTGKESPITVRPGQTYAFFQGFPAGEYSLKSFVLVGFMGAAPTQALSTDRYLVLENGSLSLFPYKVVMVARPSTQVTATSSISMSLEPLDDEQRVRIRQHLSQEPNFMLWVR